MGVEAYGRGGFRQVREEVWDEREVVGVVGGADGGWVAVFMVGASEFVVGFDCGDVWVLVFCSSSVWAYVWGGSICFQKINGSDIRNDRKWRDGGSGGDTTPAVFRLHQILHPNRDFTDGCYDDRIHSYGYHHLLPSMGWHVLWPFLPPPRLPPACLKTQNQIKSNGLLGAVCFLRGAEVRI